MSAKRNHLELDSTADSIANADALKAPGPEIEPYRTYSAAHEALVSLRNAHSESRVHEAGQRTLLTIKTPALPLAVRQVAVRLAMFLCAHPATDSVAVITALALALSLSEPSIRCEIYQALVSLHELKGVFASVDIPKNAKRALDMSILSDLNHSQHHLRGASLAILAIAKPCEQTSVSGEVFSTICSYNTDAHPKVRQAALRAIQRQHMMGATLPVELYDECVVATKDDFEQVRLVAVELVWVISSAYPEYPVVIQKYKAEETIRLLDDAFVKICDMVNDSSVIVRQRACAILGRFRDVKHTFLLQTFSKQVMSNLRRFVPRGSRGHAGRSRGNRSGPAKTFIPTPKGDADVDSDEFKLLDSGAAGAFVHGLEDEYQEVRDAAIESITELSISSTEFATKAVDFLVDMFNDSSDRVRLCAIGALVSIGKRSHIQLTEEQLSIALSAMKDANHVVREGIYRFLAVSVVARSEALSQMMSAFKTSLEKYPDDQIPIYRALKSLGRSHSGVISAPFVRVLLGISEHYLSREARIDDVVYAGNVILVMNSDDKTRQDLASVLPDYVFSHLPYLRDKYQGCFPLDIARSVPTKLEFVRQMLKRPHDNPAIAELSLGDSSKLASSALGNILKALCAASDREELRDRGEPEFTLQKETAALLASRIGEFEHFTKSATISGNNDELVLPADYAVVDYARAAERVLVAQCQATSLLRRQESLELVSKIMNGSYTMEARLIGLDPSCRLALVYLRLFAHAAWLHAHSTTPHDSRLVERMQAEFLMRAKRVEQLLQNRSVYLSELAKFTNSQSPPASEAIGSQPASNLQDKRSQFAKALLGFVLEFRLLPFSPTGLCQLSAASCSKSAAALRRPVEFNHIFPLHLSLVASLAWVVHRAKVVVTVTLPTLQIISLHPPPSALKPLSPMHWSLEWDEVPVSLPLSSGESTSVGLAIAMQQEVDVPWSDSFVVRGSMVPESYTVDEYYKSIGNVAQRHISIPITETDLLIGVNPVEFRPPPSSFTRV